MFVSSKKPFANELDISSNKIKVLKDSQEVRLSGNVNAKDVRVIILKQKKQFMIKKTVITSVRTNRDYYIKQL